MKEKIRAFAQLFILLFAMTNGFFVAYASIWLAVGLSKTIWAMLLLMALAVLSVYGYIRWIRDN